MPSLGGERSLILSCCPRGDSSVDTDTLRIKTHKGHLHCCAVTMTDALADTNYGRGENNSLRSSQYL